MMEALLQLHNLINRSNVAKDVSGWFNECIDFFEMVVNCHCCWDAIFFWTKGVIQ